jgi:hypothetical protein
MFCGCNDHLGNEPFRQHQEKYKITKVGMLPNKIKESSGLELGNSEGTFFTMNDDTWNEIYEINQSGKLIQTHTIVGSRNYDWEELAKDTSGNLFIGDIGNNGNRRKDLQIYICNLAADKDSLKTIRFNYEDQKDFPPIKKEQNFDCEAFFYFKDSLYLFSKNRGNKTEKLYTLPAKPGKYVAQNTAKVKLKGMVTAADISPDGSKFALLTYGYIYLFNVLNQQINFSSPRACIKFSKAKQAEGIVFINNDDMLISNENQYLFLAKKK